VTTVSAYSYTHSVTYVAENILKGFREIIRLTGLDPAKFVDDWEVSHRGISTWMQSGHLKMVALEIIDPRTNTLVFKWEMEISYTWSSGDGSFWADIDQLRYHMRKVGLAPSDASYRLLVTRHPGWAAVDGWSSATAYSTAGMTRQSAGSTIEHNGLGAGSAYWRKTG
jgi:hypothetical protein